MRYGWIVGVLLVAGCSSPTSPSSTNLTGGIIPGSAAPPAVSAPPVVTPPVTTPTTTPAPNPLLSDPRFSLSFYRDFALGLYSHRTIYPLTRLTRAPMIFLNTEDDRGAAIGAATLTTVIDAFVAVAGMWSGQRFGLAGVERGIGSKEYQSGWLTVKFSADTTGRLCGTSNTGQDGGVITFYYRQRCGCGASAISPAVAKHELGHAFGYFHTSNRDDVMTGNSLTQCDMTPSAQEQFHAQIAYSQPLGSLDPR